MATAKEALAAKRAAASKAKAAKEAAGSTKTAAKSNSVKAATTKARTRATKPKVIEPSETDGLTRQPGEQAVGVLTKAQKEALMAEAQGPPLTAFVSVTRETKKGQMEVNGVTPEGIAVRLWVPKGITPPTRIVLG